MADEPQRFRLSPNLAAVLVLLLIAVALVAWQRPWQSETSAQEQVALPSDPGAVLNLQAKAMTAAHSGAEFAAALGSGDEASQLASAVWSARELLGVDEVAWKYVNGGDVVVYDDGDARARFDVSWGGGSVDVQLRVEPQADGTFDIVEVEGTAGTTQLPVWLAGELLSQSTDGVEVIRVDGGDASIDVETMATRARNAVSAVVGSTDGELVVISPRTKQVASWLLGTSDTDLNTIAAVATARDDRDGRLPDRLVVLNPEVFATMDDRAAQIVLTHEATHVLVGGIGQSDESWVLEGFADFVALHDDTVDLSISAGQILKQVREDGVPAALPTPNDFGSSSHGLGAVYESAWLAFRMLAEEHGDKAVIAFYESVLDGTTVSQAARQSFGRSVDDITADWRRYLKDLADRS